MYVYVYVCMYAFFLSNKLNQCFKTLYPPIACSIPASSYTTRFKSCYLSCRSPRSPLCSVETLCSYCCWIGNTNCSLCKNMLAMPGRCAVDDSKLKDLWKFTPGWSQSESDCIKVEDINMGLMTSGTEQQSLLYILRLSGRNDSWEILQAFVI